MKIVSHWSSENLFEFLFNFFNTYGNSDIPRAPIEAAALGSVTCFDVETASLGSKGSSRALGSDFCAFLLLRSPFTKYLWFRRDLEEIQNICFSASA